MPKEDAVSFLSEFFGGEHHIPGKVREFGFGWYVNVYGSLATYDFNELTRLVLLAHDHCVRVELSACNMQYMKLAIHKRERTGQMYNRHPTMEEVMSSWRGNHKVYGFQREPRTSQ
jgi:hypothetical protein